VTRVTFRPRALLLTIPLVLLLWTAADLRWGAGLGMAVVVFGVLGFGGALGVSRDQEDRR